MKYHRIILIVCLMACGCVPAERERSGKLQVYASFYPIYDFTRKIAGDAADVHVLIPPGTEAHGWEPSAANMVALERADVFFYNGLGMEPWQEKICRALANKRLRCVALADGVKLLEGEGCGHEGCTHSHGHDPHIWLRPLNAKKMMENVKDTLVAADPENAAVYEANYAGMMTECEKLDAEFREGLAGLSGREIVVSHQAFGYLCAEYGLQQIAVEGLSSHSEPAPTRMAEIIREVREKNIRVIFFEELGDPKVMREIARTTGATADVLNPYEGLTPQQIAAGDDYFTVMRRNLAALEKIKNVK